MFSESWRFAILFDYEDAANKNVYYRSDVIINIVVNFRVLFIVTWYDIQMWSRHFQHTSY